MKVNPVDLLDGHEPELHMALYKDRNGNWFVACDSKGSHFCTATYDDPLESVAEAFQRATL